MLLYFVNVAVCAVIVVYYLASSLRKSFRKELHYVFSLLPNSSLPPGPWGLPVLGYIPFLAGRNPYTAFSQLADKYGGMAFVKLGKKNVLILRDPDMIRETYKLTAFSDRPNSKLKDDKLIGNKGKREYSVYDLKFLQSKNGSATPVRNHQERFWPSGTESRSALPCIKSSVSEFSFLS